MKSVAAARVGDKHCHKFNTATYSKWTNKFSHKLICMVLGHFRFGIQPSRSNLKRMSSVGEKGNLFRANKKQTLG